MGINSKLLGRINQARHWLCKLHGLSPLFFTTRLEVGYLYLSDVETGTEMLEETPRSRGASQVALVVKNLPANGGDIRDTGSI